MQSELLNVTGMTCGNCAVKVSRALQSVKGVKGVNVSIEEGKVAVQFDEHLASPDQLKAAVQNAGYGVRSDAAAKPSGVKRGCCG